MVTIPSNTNRACKIALLLGSIFLISSTTLQGQIALSDKETEANPDYNLRMGELLIDFAPSLTYQFDSNINYENGDRKQDGSAIIPGITTSMYWELSPTVILDVGADLRYRSYISGDGNDSLLVSGTDQNTAELDLEFLLGEDSLFTFGNDFSGQAATFTRFLTSVNTVNDNFTTYNYRGSLEYAQRLTPFTRINLELFRNISWVQQDLFDFNEYEEDGFSASFNSQVRDDTTAGLFVSASKIDFAESLRNDADNLRIGVEFDKTTEGGASISGIIGAQNYDVDVGNDPLSTEDGGWSPLASIGLDVSVGQFVTHSFNFYTGVNPGTTLALSSDETQLRYPSFSESYGATYQLEYLMNERTTIIMNYSISDVSESDDGLEFKTHSLELGTSLGAFEQGVIVVTLEYENRYDTGLFDAGYVRYLANIGIELDF